QGLDDARASVCFVQKLETLDVTLTLKNPRDLSLQPRRRHIDSRVLGAYRVPNPREHVSNWVCHIPLNLLVLGSVFSAHGLVLGAEFRVPGHEPRIEPCTQSAP